MNPVQRYATTPAMLAVLLSAVALYAPALTRTLIYDEAFNLANYTGSLRDVFAYSFPNNHMLHSLLLSLSVHTIGDSELVLRLPALFAALLTLALAGRTAGHLAGRPAALLSMVLLAGHPVLLEWAVSARGYSLTMLLSLLLTVLLARMPHTAPAGYRAAAALLSAALVLVLPTNLLLVAGVTLGGLTLPRRRAFFTRVALPMLSTSALVTLLYLDGLRYQAERGFLSSLGPPLDAMLSAWLAQSFGGPLGIVVLIGLPLGVWAAWTQGPGSMARRFLLLTLGLGAVVSVGALAQQTLTGSVPFVRNYVFLLPPLVILAGVGWGSLLTARRVLLWAAAPLLIAVSVGQGLDAQRGLMAPTRVDAVLDAVAANGQPGDLWVLQCCLDYPFYYYHPAQRSLGFDEAARVVFIPSAQEPESAAAFAAMYAQYGMPPGLACPPEDWDAFSAYVCTR